MSAGDAVERVANQIALAMQRARDESGGEPITAAYAEAAMRHELPKALATLTPSSTDVSEAMKREGAVAYHDWRERHDPNNTGAGTREMCAAIYRAMSNAALQSPPASPSPDALTELAEIARHHADQYLGGESRDRAFAEIGDILLAAHRAANPPEGEVGDA